MVFSDGCSLSREDRISRDSEWYFRMAVACHERIAYAVIVSGIFGLLWTVKHDGCRDSECIFVDILEMSESKASCTLQGTPYRHSFIVHACHMGPCKDY